MLTFFGVCFRSKLCMLIGFWVLILMVCNAEYGQLLLYLINVLLPFQNKYEIMLWVLNVFRHGNKENIRGFLLRQLSYKLYKCRHGFLVLV